MKRVGVPEASAVAKTVFSSAKVDKEDERQACVPVKKLAEYLHWRSMGVILLTRINKRQIVHN